MLSPWEQSELIVGWRDGSPDSTPQQDQWLQTGRLLQPETTLHGSLTGVSEDEKGTAVEPPERTEKLPNNATYR